MNGRLTVFLVVVCATLVWLPAQSQTNPSKFEVVSIKPNLASDARLMFQLTPGGRFSATGVTVKALIQQAYNVQDFQISGGTAWTAADHYDIVAKAEGVGDHMPAEQFRSMLRDLLEERFQLKIHKEWKEMPVYALVISKNGPKFQASDGSSGTTMPRRGQLIAKHAEMSLLVSVISRQLGRTVVDQTNLHGAYDFTLEWAPDLEVDALSGQSTKTLPPNTDSRPSIFTALQEQLGLRLNSEKGPVEMLLIDGVEKPSDN